MKPSRKELIEALEIALKIIEGEDLDEKYNEVCIIQDILTSEHDELETEIKRG